MNWIDFSREKPKEEPVREILLLFPNGTKGVRLTSTLPHWSADDATHWAEIEGPEWTDDAKEAKKIVDRELARYRASKEPPPTPDPFEEWCVKVGRTPTSISREVWDAAIKWKEGKK